MSANVDRASSHQEELGQEGMFHGSKGRLSHPGAGGHVRRYQVADLVSPPAAAGPCSLAQWLVLAGDGPLQRAHSLA